jgi:hypothetical protein
MVAVAIIGVTANSLQLDKGCHVLTHSAISRSHDRGDGRNGVQSVLGG